MQPINQPQLQNKSQDESAFIERELQQQSEDNCRHQEFIPLAELLADMKKFPEDKPSTSDALEQMERLSEIWDLVVKDGAPIGVELMSSASLYAAILPEANGGFRIQYFNEQGFSGHKYIGKSSHEAFEKALLDGYSELQPGMMEYLSNLPSWESEAKDIDIQTLDVSQITSSKIQTKSRAMFVA
jgi:hypothetical protein